MKGKGNINICIDCVKSCGLCSWSANLIPVAGWTAKPRKKRTHCGNFVQGYHITACPLFERDERPPHSNLWTDEEVEKLRELMKQRVSYKNIAMILNKSIGGVQGKTAKLRKENRNAPR